MTRFVAPTLGALHHRDVPTRLLEHGEIEALVVDPEGGVVSTHNRRSLGGKTTRRTRGGTTTLRSGSRWRRGLTRRSGR